jgi:hypothetical protein
MSKAVPTIMELSGHVIKTVAAPEKNGIYVIQQHEGDSGFHMQFCAVVYGTYMPTMDGILSWLDADRAGKLGNDG